MDEYILQYNNQKYMYQSPLIISNAINSDLKQKVQTIISQECLLNSRLFFQVTLCPRYSNFL